MRPIEIIAYSLIPVALTFKLLHWPGGALMLLFSWFLVLISVFVVRARYKPKVISDPTYVGPPPFSHGVPKSIKATSFLIRLALFFWLTYILFRLQFWPAPWIAFGLAVLISVAALAMIFYSKRFLNGRRVLLAIMAVFALLLFFTPYHQQFYFVNLHPTLNADTYHGETYGSELLWDRYSWLLYRSGEWEQAQIASDKAVSILTNHENQDFETIQSDFNFWLIQPEDIRRHNQQIRDGNWLYYP